MRIVVLLDRARLFRWHLALLEELQCAGHQASVQFRDTSEALPTSLTTILDFDRVRARAGTDRFSTHIAADAFSSYRPRDDFVPTLTLDLSTASFEAVSSGRRLAPLYDGSPKDHALFHALLNGTAPRLAISDSSAGGDWTIGWPALESPARFSTSLDQVSSRLVEGLLRVVRAIAAGEKPAASTFGTASRRPTSILSSAGRFAAARGVRKIARARDKFSGNAPNWHVAWRRLDAVNPPRPGVLDLSGFRILPDDGERFYADPFAIVHQRVVHVFVEEFPAAANKGIISHFTLGDDGRATAAPAPVLEAPHHLSYPFVFARDGAIWMLPEASASGGLDLYRAADFPQRWEKAARLIDKPLHDATLFSHGGFLWIAASETAYQSSSWDSLSLFWAETLLGPWHAHARNPVLIDAAAARSAGALIEAGIDLFRPAQECSNLYGGRITLKRIVRLFPEQFEEETVGTLSFTASPDILGPHTLSRAGSYEFVDFYARPSALRAGS